MPVLQRSVVTCCGSSHQASSTSSTAGLLRNMRAMSQTAHAFMLLQLCWWWCQLLVLLHARADVCWIRARSYVVCCAASKAINNAWKAEGQGYIQMPMTKNNGSVCQWPTHCNHGRSSQAFTACMLPKDSCWHFNPNMLAGPTCSQKSGRAQPHQFISSAAAAVAATFIDSVQGADYVTLPEHKLASTTC